MLDTPSRPERKVGLSTAERISRYRIVRGDCWETQLDPGHAYPQLRVGGRKVMVHRAAYEAFVGPIPEGRSVLHRCDNPRCHRPEHLFLGTAQDNMKDMVVKGRHRAGPKKEVDEKMIVSLGAVLTQNDVAECIGVSQTIISKVLRKHGVARGKTTSFGKGHGLGGRR